MPCHRGLFGYLQVDLRLWPNEWPGYLTAPAELLFLALAPPPGAASGWFAGATMTRCRSHLRQTVDTVAPGLTLA